VFKHLLDVVFVVRSLDSLILRQGNHEALHVLAWLFIIFRLRLLVESTFLSVDVQLSIETLTDSETNLPAHLLHRVLWCLNLLVLGLDVDLQPVGGLYSLRLGVLQLEPGEELGLVQVL